jgi:hypothetical protein
MAVDNRAMMATMTSDIRMGGCLQVGLVSGGCEMGEGIYNDSSLSLRERAAVRADLRNMSSDIAALTLTLSQRERGLIGGYFRNPPT